MRRKDTERLIEVIVITALKTIEKVLEAESRHKSKDKHLLEHPEKYPDAIDVEYRVIDDGKTR